MSWNSITRLALSAAALVLAMPSMANAQAKWNLPAAYPPTNYHSENLVQLGKDIEAATGGKIAITVHPGASLFKAPEIKRAVATGQAQLGEVLISIHENEDPVFGIDQVPFLATSFADAKKLWAASRSHIEKKLAGQGLTVLMAVPWGPQGIYTKKEITKIDDFKGLKFRAYNVATTRIAELAGMQSVTIQAAELPQALATGVVSSFISSGSTGYDSKVWETLTHWYDVQAWIPKNVTFINKGVLEALPKDQQDAVLAAAKAGEARGWKVAEEKAAWYIAELKAKGLKVEQPSAALKDGLKKFGAQLTDDWLKKAGADGQAILDAYRK